MKYVSLLWRIPGWFALNVLLSLDQFANVLIFGDPDETISSRFGKRRGDCRFCDWVCRWLDKIDPEHCARSIESDEGSRALEVRIRRHLT